MDKLLNELFTNNQIYEICLGIRLIILFYYPIIYQQNFIMPNT